MSEKKAIVRLDGTAVSKSGKLTRSNFFNFLRNDLDDYSNLEFTVNEARGIHNHILKMSTGSTAMTPLVCGGPACPFKDTCYFWEIGKAPLAKKCLIEVSLMKQWMEDIIDEFDVDPQNFTELAYVSEIVEIMVLDRRLNINIARAENAELIVDQNVGVDGEGDPITQKVISPFMELKEKLANRRSRVIKLMVGDRQEKYKKEAALKVKLDSDPSGKMASMRTQLETLSRQLDTMESRSPKEERRGLSPEDIIDDPSE